MTALSPSLLFFHTYRPHAYARLPRDTLINKVFSDVQNKGIKPQLSRIFMPYHCPSSGIFPKKGILSKKQQCGLG
jgi:hypothetical protein